MPVRNASAPPRSSGRAASHFLDPAVAPLLTSETLIAIPFLRYFGERVLGAILPLEVASMSAFGAMVGVYLCGKRGFQVADELDAAILRHDVAFEAAYGGAVDEYVPKFHFTKHIPEQLRLDGFLQDCFTTERKHSLVLQAAEPIRNTRSFERSVLRALSSCTSTIRSICARTPLSEELFS